MSPCFPCLLALLSTSPAHQSFPHFLPTPAGVSISSINASMVTFCFPLPTTGMVLSNSAGGQVSRTCILGSHFKSLTEAYVSISVHHCRPTVVAAGGCGHMLRLVWREHISISHPVLSSCHLLQPGCLSELQSPPTLTLQWIPPFCCLSLMLCPTQLPNTREQEHLSRQLYFGHTEVIQAPSSPACPRSFAAAAASALAVLGFSFVWSAPPWPEPILFPK